MAFPKIKSLAKEFTVPTTGKKVSMRMMQGTEEKFLLMTKESGPEDILPGMKSLVAAVCSSTPDFDVNKEADIDILYLFLKSRMMSISDKSKVTIDGVEVDIDLNDVKIKMPEEDKSVVTVDDDVKIKLRWPRAALFDEGDSMDDFDFVLASCLDKVITKEAITEADAETKEDRLEFVRTLPTKVRNECRAFLDNPPKFHHVVKYTKQVGLAPPEEKEYTLTSLQDFFSFA